jgi:hypothetical protein
MLETEAGKRLLDDRYRIAVDGDVLLFWVSCVLLGVVLAYVVVSHVSAYWCA